MKKQIALFLPRLGWGGITKNTIKLAKELKKNGYEVDIITPKIENPNWNQFHYGGRVIKLPSIGILMSLPSLIKYLKEKKPDVLISAHYYANIVAAWAKALAPVSVRLIITERAAPTSTLAPSQKLKDKFIPYLMRRIYFRADEIIAVSLGTAEELSRLLSVPLNYIKIIYNPIYKDKIFKQAEEPVNHKWFGEGLPSVILGIGNLIYQKDFSNLIRTFALVRKKINARLVIIGEGKDRRRLEKLAYKLGISKDIEILNFVDNPYKYMARADIFVLSSRFEGMPNVLVEAVAVGIPSIATDCPSGPREVLPEEALFPVENFREAAKKIIYLLKNKKQAERLLRKAQENLYKFQPEIWLQKYMKLIGN